jgi:hypothetical protein
LWVTEKRHPFAITNIHHLNPALHHARPFSPTPTPIPAPSSPGLPRPARREAVPRTITFQRKRANRRVLNEDDLLHLLRSYGEVR